MHNGQPIEIFSTSCIVVRYSILSMSKRTYQPSKQKRATTHGFLVRTATKSGNKVLQARRRKGRKVIAVPKKAPK